MAKATVADDLTPGTTEHLCKSLAQLWRYLSSWLAPDGGINGPVVHRCDLKRMFSIHDTPWTQGPVIEGLVHLYKKSGDRYWFDKATMLADAQCNRLLEDGSFKWAGHEDDRYSSLIHNALADCGILAVAEVLLEYGLDGKKLSHYVATVEINIRKHLMDRLFNESIGGFMMNVPTRGLSEAATGRFIANMNSVAAEAMIRLDLLRGKQEFIPLAKKFGQDILSLQCNSGLDQGAFGYSKTQLHCCITIYTALTLRGLPYLYQVSGDASYLRAVKKALVHLETLRDQKTGLWYHKMEDGVVFQYPIFLSGAGVICNSILDAVNLIGETVDTERMVRDILQHQLPNGAICNFIGYDHIDNGRKKGKGKQCWEDVFPTPNWNAHAFLFLSRVVDPPNPNKARYVKSNLVANLRFVYFESKKISSIASCYPLRSAVLAFYVKHLRHGFVFPIFKVLLFVYKYSGLSILKRKMLS